MHAYTGFNRRTTPQSEPIPGSSQVPNSAGGFAWAVDDWTRLDRFLILGSEGGTYYAKERQLTRENAEAVLRCIEEDGARTVARIVEISESGRAPKNEPAIFALALAAACSDPATRKLALAALPHVCRIGTHLLHFAAFVEGQRGWGRGLRDAVARWFLEKEPAELAYQLTKYQRRDAWSMRDLLRLAHPKAEGDRNLVLRWSAGKLEEAWSNEDANAVHRYMHGYTLLQGVTDPNEGARIIRDYRLPREVVPTELLNSAEVWNALLQDMPTTALIRNLATLTRIGLIAPFSEALRLVLQRIGDAERLRRARVHPLALLVALRTYALGKGIRGQHTWSPVPQVIDALDAAFYTAFGNVAPTGKRTMLALDVSGSMAGGYVAGSPLCPRDAAAAMALVTASVEPNYSVMAFSTEFQPFPVSPRERLDDVIQRMTGMSFGGTDCAQPMLHALEQNLAVDTFVVYTDSETWAGDVHPSQALQRYRDKTGIPAKLAVVGLTSGGFSIADPNDAGMLDVVGFDTATPAVLSDFSAA